jgi:SAM-dependent methyltransferase
MRIQSIISRRQLTSLFSRPPEATSVRFQGHTLPPPALRSCGARFQNDSYFVQSALEEADRFRDRLALSSTSRVLEIGCGAGRTPIGLLYRSYPIRRFDGIDVNKKAIEWCRRFISRNHPQYQFWWINARNERYNPEGNEMTSQFSVPFVARMFDIIYLHSVFTNLIEKDVRIYTMEFRRLLVPAGKVFLTAFVEEDVPPVTINPEHYMMKCEGPLHLVRYEKNHLFSIFTSYELEVERFDYQKELDGQSGIYLRRERPH